MNSKWYSFHAAIGLILMFMIPMLHAGNKIIESFESYENSDSLAKAWRVFGYASMGMELESDETGLIAPGGKYLKYIYNATTSTWGGVVERIHTDTTSDFFPLNLAGSKAGLQFYLKGDGTNNKIYFRYYQFFNDGTEARWRSQPISLTDSTWHIVRVPFVLDISQTDGLHLWYTNGTAQGTEIEMVNSLAHIGRFQINLDYPDKTDTGDHRFYLDEFRTVDFFPPKAPVQFCLEDYEDYPNTDIFKTAWQGFGYPTRDYVLNQEDDAPEGYRNAYWLFFPDQTTTWGCAFRTRAGIISNLNISSARDGGVQFLMKGDGSDNKFLFRFTDTQNNYWGTYWIPLQDTTWHWVTVPFIVDTLEGFRWLGNDPNGTYWTPIIGTIDELHLSLTRVNEIRFDVRNPVIDNMYHVIQFDAIYAVSKLPPRAPEAVDDFETYTDSDDLKLSWNQFGAGSTSLELTTETAASGTQAMKVSYNGVNGYTAVRKRNILPAHNFAKHQAGVQFWLKGDGSSNSITFRLQSGNEMWESYKISLGNTEWKHWAVEFAADSTTGFRYLGNNPDNPIWSTNVGTTQQLYGDLASIDQVRFYIRNPEAIDQTYSIIIDKIEGVDEFDDNAIVSTIGSAKTDGQPRQFSLGQNYPNPFNSNTTIEYSVANPGLVKLQVFNVLGQNVKTLVNSYQPVGTFRVTLNATELTSGIYFYRLHVKDAKNSSSFTQVKRMLYLK